MSIGSWVKFEFLDERDRPTYALNAHTGERVWGGWWYPNLITNQGLDGLAIINSISDNMGGRGNNPGIRSYLGLFTGSLAVKRPSGDVTLAQSGNIVTSSAAFFQAGDVGSEIVWDNAFQSPTEYLELIPVPRKRQMQVGFPELEFARALEHALEPAPRGTSRGRFCRRAR